MYTAEGMDRKEGKGNFNQDIWDITSSIKWYLY